MKSRAANILIIKRQEHSVLERIKVLFGKNEGATNCYLVGSREDKKEVIIIDPGINHFEVRRAIEIAGLKPVCVILTHAHPDHFGTKVSLSKLMNFYKIPLYYNKKDYGLFGFRLKPKKELKEPNLKEPSKGGEPIKLGSSIQLNILETGGHSPGSVSLFSSDIHYFEGKYYDGVIFTGDFIFKGGVGKTIESVKGDKKKLISNIKKKILDNKLLTDNFLILPGHGNETTILQEKSSLKNFVIKNMLFKRGS